jgi:glutamate racemase
MSGATESRPADDTREHAIGVFDSGVGGLTVLRALRARLPGESFVYLGDTARLPYGTKSRETVVRYSLQCAARLVARDIKALVVACNTASGVALEALRERFAPLPVIGVLDPGARAAVAATRNGSIAVIATEGTVQGGAYQRAIAQLRFEVRIVARACPLFVALAEEGWTDGPIVESIVRRYLDDLFAPGPGRPDTLVLGCTHFPALRQAIARVLGEGVTIVDSASTTADVVRDLLQAKGLANPAAVTPRLALLATDGAARFARVGGVFAGAPLTAEDVEVVDL